MLLPVGCRYRKGADVGPPDLHNALLSRFHILRCGYKSRKIRIGKLDKIPAIPPKNDIYPCAAEHDDRQI